MADFLNMTFVMMCLNLAAASYGSRPLSRKFALLLDSGGRDIVFQPRILAASLGADLYIAIRGSSDIADIVTAYEFNSVPFLTDHFVHEGSLKSSIWVLGQCRPLISSCGGRVVFTGHSLGGSIAAVCAAILRFQENNTNASAMCFATSPTYSEQISIQTRPFVTTIILNADPIPRLNPQNTIQIVNGLVPQGEPASEGLIHILEQFAEGVVAPTHAGESLTEQLKQTATEIAEQMVRNARSYDLSKVVVSPGLVYHVVFTESGPRIRMFEEGEVIHSFVEVFGRIGDHLIANYRKVFKGALDALKEAPLPQCNW
jgi:hypothetical protein